jgi:tetratricopeptide (TPR) repeat protein
MTRCHQEVTMGLELAVRFTSKKLPLQSEVEDQLAGIEGLQINGARGYRWENEELEGFFTIDFIEPGKQKAKKPRLEGLDITVPSGGPEEEIDLIVQLLDTLASQFEMTVSSPSLNGELTAGGFGAIEPAWRQENIRMLIATANQDEMSVRHRREHVDEDDPGRVEMLDATRMSVDTDQLPIYRGNCAMRIAQAFQRCGEHKLAIVTAHRVVQSLPEEAFAHILLGISFSSLGDNDTAVKVYQRAIDIDPEGQNADYAKAMIDSLAG